jgi:O-antigen/teichoic acid export membrane protein
VSTALAVLAVAMGGGLVAVAAMYLLGSVGALATSAIAFKVFFPAVRWSDLRRRVVRALLHEGAAYGMASFLNMAAFRIDAVILEAMKGPVAVGIYGVAYRFFEPLLFITWGISQAAFPRLVQERVRGGKGGSTKTFDATLAALLALYLPIAVGALFTAHWLVRVLFSARYLSAVDAALWLTGAAVFYGIAHFARMALISAQHRKHIVWVAAGTLALNLTLNLALIPHWSYNAAAAATLVTEVFEAGLLVGLHAKLVGPLRSWRLLVTVVNAASAMGAVLWVLGLRGPAALVVGPVVYVVALLGVGKVLAPDELGTMLDSLLRRRRPPDPLAPNTSPVDVIGANRLVLEAQEFEGETAGPVSGGSGQAGSG